jgi:methylase of polypeptide subunit release factors
MLENNLRFVHRLMDQHISKDTICIDATLGNGNDTLQMANKAKKVYAFDIQEQAIDTSKKLLKEHQINNVQIIHDSHENILKHVQDEVGFVTFNLGYLPGSDKTIITKSDSTIRAIESCLTLLSSNGIICITLYIGHQGGLKEANDVENHLMQLDKQQYTVLKYQFLNREAAPYTIIVEKK